MRRKTALWLLALLIGISTIPDHAQTQTDRDLNVDIELHDLELLTQDGQRMKFKTR